MKSSDRIEKRVVLRASPARVWRALTTPSEFGAWFGISLEGPLVEGREVRGTFNGTIDEQAIMAHQRALGLEPSRLRLPGPSAVFCTVVRLEPERCFAFRWIPYGIDADADPANEPTTLVEFTLEATTEGTLLTVVESGFDRVPAHRRARAFRMNEGGWATQTENLRRHVEGP